MDGYQTMRKAPRFEELLESGRTWRNAVRKVDSNVNCQITNYRVQYRTYDLFEAKLSYIEVQKTEGDAVNE